MALTSGNKKRKPKQVTISCDVCGVLSIYFDGEDTSVCKKCGVKREEI